ncbi:hypothetical protein KSX_53870 [Ktedonospora formicarum]|uniref:Uncharacterized protein n=1 Tax=Ktedonospora formicarum TaxID=2778364 RepID=A0A8J3I8A6_9CHLR|nr:hypothetical protein KSX_53870 [Ktedonospora formicarum]
MKQHRLQGEEAVHHHTQWREREQYRAAPTRKGTHLLDALENANDADQYQESTENEGCVHEWGGGTQTQAADGLADGRVGRDLRAPGGVSWAQEAKDDPSQGEQNRPSDGPEHKPPNCRWFGEIFTDQHWCGGIVDGML